MGYGGQYNQLTPVEGFCGGFVTFHSTIQYHRLSIIYYSSSNLRIYLSMIFAALYFVKDQIISSLSVS